mgnify:CR=1 FL=1
MVGAQGWAIWPALKGTDGRAQSLRKSFEPEIRAVTPASWLIRPRRLMLLQESAVFWRAQSRRRRSGSVDVGLGHVGVQILKSWQ